MKKFRKKFNLQRIRRDVCYTVQEITDLLHVHKRTVLAWQEGGLKTVDSQKPYLFHGSVLREFLSAKQQKSKSTCKPAEFYCLKCHAPMTVWGGVVDITIINQNRVNFTGLCDVCGTTLNRLTSVSKLPETVKPFIVQQIHNQHLIESLGLSCITHFKQGETIYANQC